jgi:hypothetical protein
LVEKIGAIGPTTDFGNAISIPRGYYFNSRFPSAKAFVRSSPRQSRAAEDRRRISRTCKGQHKHRKTLLNSLGRSRSKAIANDHKTALRPG